MTFEELPDILLTREVAEYLRIGINTATDLVHQGHLRNIGTSHKRFLIPKTSLAEFMARDAGPKPAEP